MLKKRLLWQLYPSYFLLTVIAVLAVAWYTSHSLRTFFLRQVSNDLQSSAFLVRDQIASDLGEQDLEAIERFCKTTGLLTTRITIILPDGQVIGDSKEEPAGMESHADRPEFRQALAGKIGSSTRFSDTLEQNMMYLAIPMYHDNDIIAVVRTSVPVSAIDDQLDIIYHKILWAVLIVAFLTAIISLALSKRISRPIERIKEAALRYASGDFSIHPAVSKPEEVSQLAKAMHQMATQLNERIDTITAQNAESDAILSGMIEGVIAIDSDRRIVRINRAATAILNVTLTQPNGHYIEEVIRNTEVAQFAQQALDSSVPLETEVVIVGDEKKHLKLHAAHLSDIEDHKTGAVIVLTDMTRIRQLQKVKSDFVANVSHELKTPITSIKGFVETLQEGAINEPQQARRFLEIIGRHSDRLNAIIDDLLALSRLEEDVERRAMSFEITPLKPVLTEAIDLSAGRAEEKRIRLDLTCPEDLQARINPALLEQAVMNLINNAIKYSEEDSRIEIVAEQADDEIRIAVRDQGCGIEPKYHDRIFHRFYVVDKSRSRKLGGTGLGLAIVKHIAQVHNGHVTLDSQPGRGSTFTIGLPVESSEG